MIEKLVQKWKNYRYRFTPWLAVNLKQQVSKNVRVVKKDPDEIIDELTELLVGFRSVPNTCLYRGNTFERRQEFNKATTFNREWMLTRFGFNLNLAPSKLKNGGTGVFVQQGCIKRGQVAALYPGTVYESYQPILLASLGNAYVFRCSDGRHIDGKSCGLSGLVYRSCHGRDRVNGMDPLCDVSWLHVDHNLIVNPLNVGQIVNNRSHVEEANVTYEEVDIKSNYDFRLRSFLPNVRYNSGEENRFIRIVPLIATKDIHAGQELFSTYFTLVN